MTKFYNTKQNVAQGVQVLFYLQYLYLPDLSHLQSGLHEARAGISPPHSLNVDVWVMY